MKFFWKCFFAAAPAAVLACAFCGVPSFAQDHAAADVKDSADVFRAVRAEAFARFDKDGKGHFTLDEWPGRRRAFRLMDVNGDGRVTLEEFQSLRNRWRNRTFENLDLDGNRAITRDEWIDVPEDFDRFDRNKDGIILRHEFYDPR
jgi:Ca2+-binding EF-hand superfamily protein